MHARRGDCWPVTTPTIQCSAEHETPNSSLPESVKLCLTWVRLAGGRSLPRKPPGGCRSGWDFSSFAGWEAETPPCCTVWRRQWPSTRSWSDAYRVSWRERA